jgi:arylsulfatase A-like enzyme
MANYLGEITGIDTAMGELRQGLREMGIADNTLLWYTSDNGAQGPGSTGGLRGKKGSLWEGGVRVPTIIEWPAVVKSPRTTDVVGSTVDISPTLLDLLDLKPADDRPLDGVSLLPLIEGEPFERDKGVGFWVHPTGGIPRKSDAMLAAMLKEQTDGLPAAEDVTQEGTTWEPLPENHLPGVAAWMDGPWKLHRILAGKGQNSVLSELYNLEDDPQEKHNVAADEPERVEKMRAALEEWQRSVVQSHNGEDYSTATAK